MSINVTVSGNPVSIKRGKLISTDPEHAKKEFEKRRRLRLEQVRHQSKEIAENVRNKVRKERKKQNSDFEKQEEEQLKKWKNRKLLDLQEEYSESLKDIGLGHAQAAIENDHEEGENKYREKLREKAQERGNVALQKVQAEQYRQNIKKTIPLQHKTVSRDIENVRSAMVSKSKKTPSKKRKKKATTNINITSNLLEDSISGSESDDHEALDISSDDLDSSVSTVHEPGARKKRTKSKSPSSTSSEVSSNVPSPKHSVQTEKLISKRNSANSNQYRQGSPKRVKSPLPTVPEVESTTEYPMIDTRISDRIRNRRYLLNPTPQVQEPFSKYLIQSDPLINTELRRHASCIPSNTIENQQITHCPTCMCTCGQQIEKDIRHKPCTCKCCNSEKNNLPIKPTVSLRNASKTSKELEKNENKVQYYDHSNRYSKEYINSKSDVRKIPEESLDICTSTSSEAEFMERIYKQDKDAQIRGQKAMEKVNIHKDYKEMMKKLPVLQRQERIASISTGKPIFHMSDERLKQYEKRKQNHMEDAYEKHFPKTITIAPKKHVYEEEPFRTVDIAGTDPSLNVAQWDVGAKPTDNGFTLTKDSGTISIEADSCCTNKENYLKYLLERLKVQKEMLLREVASLPQNSNLNNIISDLELLKNQESGGAIPVTTKKVSSSDSNGIPDTTNNSERFKKSEKVSTNQKRNRQAVLSTSNSSTSSTPPKKIKHKIHKIILQNTSTQTSPKINSDENDKENSRQNSSTKMSLKEKKLARRPSPKKISAKSSSIQGDNAKIKISRPTSPIKLTFGKNQVTSSITSDKFSEKVKSKVSECKCCLVEKHTDVSEDQNRISEGQSDVCEILIKIKDNEEPEIQVKSPRKHKNIVVRDLRSKSDDKVKTVADSSDQKAKEPTRRMVKIDDKKSEKESVKPTSWRERLSKNDTTVGTSTSTSYYSPPDFSKSDFSNRPQAQSTGYRSSNSSANASTKVSNSKKKMDPRLITYIKKLLAMSRPSVEDLGVSTVSDISTPSGSSFDNNSKNEPMQQLRNIIKYFNLNPEDLAHYLNYSGSEKTSSSQIDPNFSATPSTIHSSGYEASKSRGNNASNSLSDRSRTQESKVDSNRMDSALSSSSGQLSPCPNKSNDLSLRKPIAQYGQLAKLCEERISELSAMIDKVRMEKQQILSPGQSDKENSTQYLKLPSHIIEKSPSISHDSSDLEQAEINRKLLEIDYSLAEKLRNMPPQERTEYNKQISAKKLEIVDDIDDELVDRYKKLNNVYETISSQSVEVEEQNIDYQSPSTSKLPETGSYVPVLLDIPRLPKLILSQENSEQNSDSLNGKQKKPPPSKGLTAARRFNENMIQLPHELSTIVEVDSQLSTKVRISTSPQTNKDSPKKIFETTTSIVLPEVPADLIENNPTEDEKKTSDGSVPDLVAEISASNEEKAATESTAQNQDPVPLTIDSESMMKNKRELLENVRVLTVSVPQETSSDTSTDKSEMENIELMLQSMGMGWAISTLRKTQAALTKSSSSSSIETGAKQQPSNDSSISDITLRDILGKKIFSNSTSISLSQSISPNFIKGLTDISAIQGSAPSSETKHHRTSTPVQTTKSSDSKKGIFTAESEVSSVKLTEEHYVTMKDSTGSTSR